jgi:3-oxoadipate enol-lactonase
MRYKSHKMKKEVRIRGINMVYDDLGGGEVIGEGGMLGEGKVIDEAEAIGGGEVILLIHGQPFNRSMWDDQKAVLAQDYRLIIPDLRGYGESDVTEGIVLLDELALDLVHLLDSLGVRKAVIVGLSMGGQIALEIFRWAPALFRAIVLADTDARAEDEAGYQNRIELSKRILAEGMEQFTEERIGRFMCDSTFMNKPDVVERVKKMMKTTPAAGSAAAQRGRAERKDYTPLLGQIDFPALIVVGDKDEFTPIASADYMHQRIKGSELAIIKDSGHITNMEQAEAFNGVLGGFLRELSSSGTGEEVAGVRT